MVLVLIIGLALVLLGGFIGSREKQHTHTQKNSLPLDQGHCNNKTMLLYKCDACSTFWSESIDGLFYLPTQRSAAEAIERAVLEALENESNIATNAAASSSNDI